MEQAPCRMPWHFLSQNLHTPFFLRNLLDIKKRCIILRKKTSFDCIFRVIFKLFILIISFAYYAAYAVDFESPWQRHAAVRPVDEQLRQYLSATIADASSEEHFKNLDRNRLKNWFLPFLKDRTQSPAFKTQHLLELFTNLHDSMPDSPEKSRLADPESYDLF